jgi:hypothetical protein
MKTFRMIGMALFAVFMCVNFASCSSSDDEPKVDDESGVVTNEKKLVEIKYTNGGKGFDIHEFIYDNQNRLSSSIFTEYNSGVDKFQYTWGNGVVIARNLTFSLDNNLIKSAKGSSSFNDATFTYNSSAQIIKKTNKTDYGTDNFTYTWNNGKLTEWYYDSWQAKISYGNKTCKGYFPLMANVVGEVDMFLAHPELVGMKTNYLPSKIIRKCDDYHEVTEELSYTFTNDGYIETCTIKSKFLKYGVEDFGTSIYTFKWQ